MNMRQLLCLLIVCSLSVICLSDATVDEAAIKKMKIKEVRKFLDDRGVACDGCFEKADFVKKAVANMALPILDSRKPKVVNNDPIEKQWAPQVMEICEAETDKPGFCKQLKAVVDGAFYQYMRKYKRDLSVTEAHTAEISFKHPYSTIMRKMLKETVQHMVQKDSKKQDLIRKKFEPTFIPWLRDVALENPNPMFEELGEMGANMKKKGSKRGDEL